MLCGRFLMLVRGNGRKRGQRCSILCTGSFLFVILTLCAEATSCASSLPNERWRSIGGTCGVNSEVFALAATSVSAGISLQDRIYVAGSFSKAGDLPAAKIAYWQNHAFYPIATSINGSVYAITVLPNNQVVIGGDFTSVDGKNTRYIARWDGSQWGPVGTGTNGPVYALASDTSGTIYLGGQFSLFNGHTANNVASWTEGGSSSGLGGGTNARVHTLLWANNRLYVGGQFTSAGGQGYARAAIWDPAQNRWFGMGTGISGFAVFSFTADTSGTVYAGGAFSAAGGQPASNVAKWNGSSWAPMGAGLDGAVAALHCTGEGTVYAGGFFQTSGGQPMPQLARWQGGSWTACGLTLNPQATGTLINAIVSGPVTGDVYVAGRFEFANDLLFHHVARGAPGGWRQLRPGFDSNVYAVAVDGLGDLYVGGLFGRAGDGMTTARRSARWDGQRWYPVGNKADGTWFIRSLVWDTTGVLYASFLHTRMPDGGRWEWGVQRLNHDSNTWEWYGGADLPFYNIAALSWSPAGILYAGGLDPFIPLRKLVDGFWEIILVPFVDPVHVLLHDPSGNGDLYVGGAFATHGHIVRLSPQDYMFFHGNGLNGPVYALAKIGGVLYAGGDFSATRGSGGDQIPLANLGAFSDTWHDVAGGVNGRVNALEPGRNGELFVGGAFLEAGAPATSASRLAVFDGATWGAVGEGCDNDVFCIRRDGAGNLWVAGSFTEAGGLASPHLACYPTSAFLLHSSDSITTSGDQWSVGLGFTEPGLAENYWGPEEGALFARVYADPTRYRVTGRLSRPALWLPYAAVGTDRYVRARFFVYATGNDNWQTTGAMPNLRLRVAHRFSQTAMLEVFNHTNVDPEASTRFGPEIRPSVNPASPSLYRVDMDPVDVPFLAQNAQSEGFACGFEAYAMDPQDEGYVALAEVQLGTYPCLEDLVAPAQVFKPSETDAGTLAVRNPDSELSIMTLIPRRGVGEFPRPDIVSPQPVYSEGSWGICLDTRPVLASRYGVIQREFWPGEYDQRIRIAPGKIYKIRYHVISPQDSNRQSQMRLRARTVRYLWCQKFEVGGAWGAGPENNLCAAQALPGVGCMNPDKLGSENGGWYTLLIHSPLDERIRSDYPAGTPLSVSMPNLYAEPGMGENAYSFRDLRICFDNLDTLSGSAMNYLEEGCFVLDRIEVRGYFDIWD